MKICIIAAVAPNRAIGFQGRLPWNIPEDLHHFKALTKHHAVVMGRKTFESLPMRPLPERQNIVVSSTMEPRTDCVVVRSLAEAISRCTADELWVIGGESIYREALPLASRLCLTLVDSQPTEADAFFPEVDWARWKDTKKEKHHGFSFVEYELL